MERSCIVANITLASNAHERFNVLRVNGQGAVIMFVDVQILGYINQATLKVITNSWSMSISRGLSYLPTAMH